MVDWSRGHNSSSAMEQMLDAENKRMTENLSSKVSRLKSLALDIDKDTEDQNRYLDGMSQFSVTWGCREERTRFEELPLLNCNRTAKTASKTG
ncbi:BET1-like protein isoform X5 [Latimeria chalumnae]|uniref:BET1-like protein isoform X5 n=1 Tax=Latimeria chalumnae TaxID=7897 RepID=UPI0003C12D21|nr:PREDICTED: BET1-like protein isoform X2 [Latimeria chalumnae]|eukprot:XP_006012270.1 PREDICTED: BET1-like protein isoform X2 [Latimeria chalumnae]